MKQAMKRLSAGLLALILCLSLLSGISVPAKAASVTYVTVNLSGYGEVIKNWGTRGEEATFLSPNAESFYATNNTSYDVLATYTGSSNVNNVPSSTLYKQLQSLMKNNHDEITSYNDTKELYQYTDCQNSGKTTTKISSFYSGTLIGPAWDGGNTWNREHTWPNSKGLGGSDENDIMMLRPTSKSENSSRGNTAYGESSGYYDPNQASGGKLNLHGDVARIMLYQYVRWGNTSNMWGAGGVMENRTVLLKWMEEDPVDTWELGRNDSVETITGTRNVFVDYPELAFLLLGAEIPGDMVTPSGEAASAAGYTITATSSNTAHGTVKVSGKTINATPATGYQVSGYTLLSGTADVTRSGNTFTVKATSDCAIRIDFAPRAQQTVRFSENGETVSTKAVYGGDTIQLPGHTSQLPEGYTFMGWVDRQVAETSKIPSYYAVGSNYTVGADVMLYALYAVTKDGGSVSSNVFKPYSGALTEGDYIIVSGSANDGDFALVAESTGSKRLQCASVSYTGADIICSDNTIIWHIAPGSDAWTIYNTASGNYAAGTGVKNNAGLITSVTEFAQWNSRNDGYEYEFINVGNLAKGVNPRLRFNGATVGWACYADSTASVGVPLNLYKRAAGSAFYFTVEDLTVPEETTPTEPTEPEETTPTEPTEPEETTPTEPAEPETPAALNSGDQVVIYAPAYGKALSADKVDETSYYNKGVEVTEADGVVTGYSDAEIWTVSVNSDGSYSFANGGQNIGLGAQYSSMNLGEVNDDWELISLGGSLYNLKNTGRGNFLEWYASKGNWSTYNSDKAATDNQFQMSFYIIGKGILSDGATPDVPDVPDEPSEPETTEIVDIATALAGAEGTKFTVKGVVTAVDSSNYYVQDTTGAICVRLAEKTTEIALGDTIIGTGTKSVYNGMPQLQSATFELSSGMKLTANETKIGSLTLADICTYVTIKGLTVTEIYDNNGQYTSPNVTVEDAEGNTIQIYKAAVAKEGDTWAIQVGDVIDVTAAVGYHVDKFQLRNTLTTEIVLAGSEPSVPPAEPGDDVALADFNGDGVVTDADAVYLLRHTLFAEEFPITLDGDVNGDGETTDADAVYLLRYTLFPEEFPLKK